MAEFRKHDDPLAGLTARALARRGAPASACPDASALAAYFERMLSDAEAAQHEQHFAACQRCQQQLAILARLETAAPVAATDPTRAADRGWRKYWNWKIWAPAAAALGALALWIAGMPGSARMDWAASKPTAQTEIAENRAPQAAPAGSALSAGRDAPSAEVSRKDAARPTEPSATARSEEKKRDFIGGLKSDKPMALAGPVKQVPVEPARIPAAPPPPPAPTKEVPAEERALAKVESVDEMRLRDAQKKQAAQAPTPQAATAQAEQERAGAQADTRVAQNEALRRQRVAGESDVAAMRAGSRQAGLMMAPQSKTVHAPAPSLTLWRISGGRIEKSLDSGRTWHAQAAPASAELLAGSAPSEEVCWLTGRKGAVLRTTNGGAKWEKLSAPSDADLIAIEARDAENATVTAADGRRFVTADGGRTWKPLN